MPDRPRFHHAFRYDYSTITPELTTEVLIGPPVLSGPVSQHTEKTEFKGIWDTGATHSVITAKVVKILKLKPIALTTVRGVGGVQNNVPVYLVNIYLPNHVYFPNWQVMEGAVGDDEDVLIGMDIIQQGDFNISNPGNPRKTVFSFCLPSHDRPVDLLEKSNKVNERNKKKAKRRR